MHAFIVRFYGYLLAGLIAILMVLSYLLGREGGAANGPTSALTLACSPQVLETLAIKPPAAVEEQTEGIATAPEAIPATPAVLSGSTTTTEPDETAAAPKGKYMGSKNGTKYYTPGCPGALRIKAENYVWFSTAEDATMQGYSQGSC